jgi:hypothetical protein
MPSVPRPSTRRCYASVAEWPSWTDEIRLELGPDPEDARWAAENFNDGFDFDGPVPDEVLDLLADEAAAQDRIDRGFSLL